jgi:hypothetical protein
MANKGVTDFDDAKYREQLAQLKGQAAVPVGHVPMPGQVPRLDQRPNPDQPAASLPRTLSPEQMQMMAQQGQLVQGVGMAYPSNQPALRPTRGGPGAAGHLTPEQVAATLAEQTRSQGPAGQALPGPQIPTGAPAPQLSQRTQEMLVQAATATRDAEAKQQSEEEKLVGDIEKVAEEEFEIDGLGARVRTLLNNKDRRKAIEARCDPMDLEQLIIHGEVRQQVPIAPRSFYPTYRTVGGHEDLYVKRKMTQIEENRTTTYVLDRFALYNLTLGLYAFNGRVLPTHLKPDGEPDDKLFDVKFTMVSRWPLAVLADLSVNYVWFADRVQRLTVVDEIKGF